MRIRVAGFVDYVTCYNGTVMHVMLDGAAPDHAWQARRAARGEKPLATGAVVGARIGLVAAGHLLAAPPVGAVVLVDDVRVAPRNAAAADEELVVRLDGKTRVRILEDDEEVEDVRCDATFGPLLAAAEGQDTPAPRRRAATPPARAQVEPRAVPDAIRMATAGAPPGSVIVYVPEGPWPRARANDGSAQTRAQILPQPRDVPVATRDHAHSAMRELLANLRRQVSTVLEDSDDTDETDEADEADEVDEADEMDEAEAEPPAPPAPRARARRTAPASPTAPACDPYDIGQLHVHASPAGAAPRLRRLRQRGAGGRVSGAA